MNDKVINNPRFKNNDEFSRSLMFEGKGAKSWPNTHTEVEYLGDNRFAASISAGHRVFFDKADNDKPKKHKLSDERPNKDYIFIQSAKCCVEVNPYFATYYDTQHEEIRVHEERWVVQRLLGEPDIWQDVNVYNPRIATEEYSEPAGDIVKATITYDTDYGVLSVQYFQRDGNNLKHNVTFKNTSDSTETFRIIQRWLGIVAIGYNKVVVVPSDTNATLLNFRGVGGKTVISEDLSGMAFDDNGVEKTGQCLQRPIRIKPHAQGMEADFIYGNWGLDQNESLEIDPITYSSDNPTEDGRIHRFNAVQGNCAAAALTEDTSGALLNIGGVAIPAVLFTAERSYVEWDISSLAGAVLDTNPLFKYHAQASNSSDAEINPISNQPSVSSTATIWADMISGTAYVDPWTFGTGPNLSQDLGATAKSELQSAMDGARSWFAIGLVSQADECPSSTKRSEIYSEEKTNAPTPKPTLYVTYIIAPTVTTQAVTSVEATTGTGNGNITNTGGENCTKRGIAYDTVSRGDPGTLSPAASDYANYEEEIGSFGTGAFTRSLTGLPTGTTIYARAYAYNPSVGYNWGSQVSFLTKPAAPTNVAATDGSETSKVVVTWTKSTGATGYRVYRDGGDVSGLLGDVATYDDTGAGAGIITPGTAAASDGSEIAHVVLSLSGESVANGTTHTYKVVAVNATGNSADSSTNTGYRGVGAITYQWQRSAADSDADYSNIGGATTDPYNDTGAPSNGDGRFFKCVLSATGASNQTSTADRGYRGLEPASGSSPMAQLLREGLV